MYVWILSKICIYILRTDASHWHRTSCSCLQLVRIDVYCHIVLQHNDDRLISMKIGEVDCLGKIWQRSARFWVLLFTRLWWQYASLQDRNGTMLQPCKFLLPLHVLTFREMFPLIDISYFSIQAYLEIISKSMSPRRRCVLQSALSTKSLPRSGIRLSSWLSRVFSSMPSILWISAKIMQTSCASFAAALGLKASSSWITGVCTAGSSFVGMFGAQSFWQAAFICQSQMTCMKLFCNCQFPPCKPEAQIVKVWKFETAMLWWSIPLRQQLPERAQVCQVWLHSVQMREEASSWESPQKAGGHDLPLFLLLFCSLKPAGSSAMWKSFSDIVFSIARYLKLFSSRKKCLWHDRWELLIILLHSSLPFCICSKIS